MRAVAAVIPQASEAQAEVLIDPVLILQLPREEAAETAATHLEAEGQAEELLAAVEVIVLAAPI